MTDYTDLKARLKVEGDWDRYSFGEGADPDICTEAAAAIAALQAQVRKMALDVLAASGQAQEAYQAQLAAEAERDALRGAEASLCALLQGEFSSLTIGFNDDHACNYATAEKWRDEYGFYTGDAEDIIDWVSDEERQMAIAQNSVWTLQWYPQTPVGFNCIGASSLGAILEHVAALTAKP